MHTRLVLLFALVLSLMLTACSRDNVDVQLDPGSGIVASIALTEGDINTMIVNALNAAENPLLRNPQVDLRTGQIIVSGEHDRRDGGGRVSGTVTLVPQVVNGALDIQITAATIEGVSINDSQLQDFANRLESAINSVLSGRNGGAQITLQSLTVTDSEMNFSLRITRSS